MSWSISSTPFKLRLFTTYLYYSAPTWLLGFPRLSRALSCLHFVPSRLLGEHFFIVEAPAQMFLLLIQSELFLLLCFRSITIKPLLL